MPGYFGGSGSGKGWSKLKFIISPDEFKSIFNQLAYSFIITDRRVKSNYRESDKKDIFNAYSVFYKEIMTEKKRLDIRKHTDRILSISIIDDINKIAFNTVSTSTEYKLAMAKEPVINVTPFYLLLKDNNKLSTAYFHLEGTIGLEIHYPLTATWWDDEKKAITVDTSQYKGYQLFNTLVKRIKKITHLAKIDNNGILNKPNCRISDAAKEEINNNEYLKANNLIFI